MRTVGLFAELNPARPDVFRGSIHAAVRTISDANENALVEYLKSGIPLIDIMEASVDVISGNEYITGGSCILTDGEWVWRQDLSYYVEKYHLVLDDEFVRHVKESKYRVIEPERDQLISLAREAVRDIMNMA